MSIKLFHNKHSVITQPIHNISNAKFLVTGGSGIVGLHFICSLLLNGARPENINATYHTGLPDCLPTEIKSIHWIPYETCFLDKYDFILHSATYAQPLLYTQRQFETIKLNTTDLIKLIEQSLADNGRILFVSSSDFYRGCNDFPNNENQCGLSDPWDERSSYIESKRMGEAICAAAARSGINAKVARLSLGYGAGYKYTDKRVMYEFIKSALENGQIKMKDTGLANRTYLSMSDCARMMLNIAYFGCHSVYNVGGNSHLTILELARKIGEMTGASIELGPIKPTDKVLQAAPNDVWLDMKRYTDEFDNNFETLDEALPKVIQWMQYLINSGVN